MHSCNLYSILNCSDNVIRLRLIILHFFKLIWKVLKTFGWKFVKINK